MSIGFVYWIACVGAHWRYGKLYNPNHYPPHPGHPEDTMVPSIEWQFRLHDDKAYNLLCAFAREVKQL